MCPERYASCDQGGAVDMCVHFCFLMVSSIYPRAGHRELNWPCLIWSSPWPSPHKSICFLTWHWSCTHPPEVTETQLTLKCSLNLSDISVSWDGSPHFQSPGVSALHTLVQLPDFHTSEQDCFRFCEKQTMSTIQFCSSSASQKPSYLVAHPWLVCIGKYSNRKLWATFGQIQLHIQAAFCHFIYAK